MRPYSVPLFFALGLSLLFSAGLARAQAVPSTIASPSASAGRADDTDTAELNKVLASAASDDASTLVTSSETNDIGPRGIVPFLRGFNASLGTTSQHDSAGGWQWILTPTLAFRFNRHFSVLAGLPVYSYINIIDVIGKTTATKTKPSTPIYGFRKRNFLLGDTNISGQFETSFRPFDYAFTTTLGAPSGDDNNGLGAGQFTYNLNNHFERSLPHGITPELEIGIGNSPNLVDPRVRKTYTDVGTNAHFQLGINFQLPHNISFTSDAFEELPLSTQTFTSTTTNGKKGKQLQTFTTVTNKSVGEDNGFLNTLDIPLSPHVTLSGFYNRSLRNRIDTAGFSFTFLLIAPPHNNENSR